MGSTSYVANPGCVVSYFIQRMNLVLPKSHCFQEGYLDYLAQINLIPCLLLNPVAL